MEYEKNKKGQIIKDENGNPKEKPVVGNTVVGIYTTRKGSKYNKLAHVYQDSIASGVYDITPTIYHGQFALKVYNFSENKNDYDQSTKEYTKLAGQIQTGTVTLSQVTQKLKLKNSDAKRRVDAVDSVNGAGTISPHYQWNILIHGGYSNSTYSKGCPTIYDGTGKNGDYQRLRKYLGKKIARFSVKQ